MDKTQIADEKIYIAFTTCPNEEVAAQIARQIVERRLAACINLIPGVLSFFHWEGKVQSEKEVILKMKIPGAKLLECETFLRTVHPYKIFEWTAVPCEYVSEDYRNWVRRCFP